MGSGGNVTFIDSGPEIHLRSWFNDPYNDAISAARTCYSPRVIDPDEVTEQQRENIGPLTFEGGHHTVYQHATFEFGLSGISRQFVWAFLHAFPFYNTEQQSQRYVKLDEITAHVPPTLQGREREIFSASIERSWRAYQELTERLTPVTRRILSDLWRLPARKSMAFAKNIAREAEKRAIETARYVIPIACHTAMVYTVSGIVLHRLRRMIRVGDVPREAADVVGRMVEEVERIDADFFERIGEPPREFEDVIESQIAPPGVGDAGGAESFDKSLNGRSSRLIDYSVRAPEIIADAIRHVLGRFDLDDDTALELALDPAKNKYRVDTLNISTHAPIMRPLAHAHYTFRKKLSHTADSQDQRHRTVPGSRPLLSRTVPRNVDVIEPELIRDDPECHELFSDAVGEAWHARERLLAEGVEPELALYVIPNAVAVRFEESGALLDLIHKWTMRSCFNAQREIWQASMDEIEQVGAVHPSLTRHIGPPCFVRTGVARPRCTEGKHFCGIPVWKSYPEVARTI
jgi:thymidylate synthase ThyX